MPGIEPGSKWVTPIVYMFSWFVGSLIFLKSAKR